ncbi:hypothetical protein D9M70_486350 [compost metagenome]
MYQTTAWPAVRPSRARITIFRLRHCANDSVSGALEVLPSAFMRWNAGDSFIDSRMYTDIPSSRIDSRKGMRQPQVSNAGPVSSRHSRITISDRNRPSVAVVWIHEVYAPRLPCGACSAT